MNPAPLLIIMGTILGLLVIQRILASAPAPQIENRLEKTAASGSAPVPGATTNTEESNSSLNDAPTRQRGRKLTKNLSVTGLDERGVSSLKALIGNGDASAITTFLAFNRPGFVELDETLQHRRQQKANADQPVKQTLLDKLMKPLTGTERKLLLGFNPRSSRLISRDLMSRFGGHAFSVYFSHYAARPQSITLHVPPFDPDRKILEGLVASGVARKGRHIPLNDRLTVLKMSQLRQMAKDLNLDKKFTRKQDAAKILADVPGAAVLLSMQYVIDDLFMLVPIKEDTVLIKHEWSYLEAYAKMLSNLKL